MSAKSLNSENKILEAAEKEFIEKGFDAARTTSIAQRAGVTHAMLHYYFRTKENLFEKIISKYMGLIGELVLTSLTDSDLPLFDKISTAISRHLNFIGENPNLPQFFIREVYSHPERLDTVTTFLQHHAKTTIAKLQEDIDASAARGECRKVNAEMLMLDIISLNIFSFLLQPVMDILLNDLFSDKEHFLEERKKENIETIVRKLRVS